VSLAWAEKISSARKRTGFTDRPLYRPEPKARVDREAVESILLAKPNLFYARFERSCRPQPALQSARRIYGRSSPSLASG
jgi:hypothetical protein